MAINGSICMPRIPEQKWEWFGSPLHFICASYCKFHLGTKIGKYLVSTVGEMYIDREHEKLSRMEQIGCDRLFETFVFYAIGTCKEGCCPRFTGNEIDSLPANDRKTANRNHLKLCRKYAKQ